MTLVACTECGTQVTAGLECPLCGTPTPAPAPAPAPAADPAPAAPVDTVARHRNQWEVILEKLRRVTAPKYRVQRVLGFGGMAGVYLAEEPRLGRLVAIKVMSPGLMVDPQLVERFSQEARTIAQFNHPHIVTIYEVDEREDLHYFTMTYVAGRTLGQVMSESVQPLPIDVVRAWLYQIGDALAYAHHHGVVHRDIKPGNVLLDLRGNALVTDFGIAKVADEPGLTRTGMLVGTPAYMSPEQCSSGKVTGASDQYSVGAVAYQMLTGQPVFSGPTLAVLQAHVAQEPPPIRDLRPDCPDDLVAAVQRMLEKRAEDRWPTMSAAVAGAGAAPPGLDGPVRKQLETLAAQAAAIRVAPWFDVVREGASEQIQATVADAAGQALEGRRLDWRSGDPLVASVDGGRLRALTPGVTTIQVSCSGVSTSLDLTVESDPVPAVEIEPDIVSVPVGGKARLHARVSDWDGKALDDRAVLWSSSNSTVARVSPDGLVEGLRAGEAVINASTGGKAAAAKISVGGATASGRGFRGAPVGATVVVPTPAAKAEPEAEPTHTLSTPRAGTPSPAHPATPVPAAKPAIRAPAGKPGSRSKVPLIVGTVAVLTVVALAVVRPWQNAGSASEPAPLEDPLATQATQAGQPPDPGGEFQPPIQPGTTNVAAGQTASPAGGGTRQAGPAPDSTRTTAARSGAEASGAGTTRTGTRSGDPPATASRATTPTPEDPTPPAPTTGTLQISGTLPAGAAITLRQPDGRTQPLSGRSLTLPPGTYGLEFSAPGYEGDRTSIVIRAGETGTWTPTVRAVPPPTAAPTQPPPEQPAARDVRADQAAIEARVREFVDAFGRRDVNTVVPLLPAGAVRDAWRPVLESRDVTNFRAALASIEPATVDGDTGTVRFRIQITFESQNAERRPPPLNFTGSAERAGTGWRLVSLQQGGG